MQMKLRTGAVIILIIFLSVNAGTQFCMLANANFYDVQWPDLSIIYIRSDGSIDPPDAPLRRDGCVYTVTGSMLLSQSSPPHYHEIIVNCENIVLDGAGYVLSGAASMSEAAIRVKLSNNITIRNFELRTCLSGIWVTDSNSISISQNLIVDCGYGIILSSTNRSTVIGNDLKEDYYKGVRIENSAYGNIVTGNLLSHTTYGKGNRWGICLTSAVNNTIIGNEIKNHNLTMRVFSSYNNTIFCNNFMGMKQTDDPYLDEEYRTRYNPSLCLSINTWSNGTQGNYWNDYAGSDIDSNGVGDTPYSVYVNNTDEYPLMNPLSISPVTISQPVSRLTDHSQPYIPPTPSPSPAVSTPLQTPTTPKTTTKPIVNNTPSISSEYSSITSSPSMFPTNSTTQQPSLEPSQSAQPRVPAYV